MKLLLTLILFTVLIFPITTVYATTPVTTSYISDNEKVILTMHHEDASLIGEIDAKVRQDLAALEHAFLKLQNDGLLDKNFPRLAIIATMNYDVANRFEAAPTLLYRSDSAFKVSVHPESPKFEPVHLGKVYVIQTSPGLLNFEDLALMMTKLTMLDAQNALISIRNEEELKESRSSSIFDEIMRINFAFGKDNIVQNGLRIEGFWESGNTRYTIVETPETVIKELPQFDVYLGKPMWAPLVRNDMLGRIVALASKDEAMIYDIKNEKQHVLNLNFEYIDPEAKRSAQYMVYQRVEFAMHEMENKVFVLSFGSMGQIIVAYALDLDTGVWTRELEAGSVSDEVWMNLSHGLWLEFSPALKSNRIENIHVVTNEEEIRNWSEMTGQRFVEEELPEQEPNVPAVEDPTEVEEPSPPIEEEIILEEELVIDETEGAVLEQEGTSTLEPWTLLLLFAPLAFSYMILRNTKKRTRAKYSRSTKKKR